MSWVDGAFVAFFAIGIFLPFFPTMFVSRRDVDKRAAPIGMLGLYSTAIAKFTMGAEIIGDDAFVTFYRHWMSPAFAFAYLAILIFGLRHAMQGLFASHISWWCRILLALGMLFSVPMGFAGAAPVIDGRPDAEVLLYYVEFVFHAINELTFGNMTRLGLLDPAHWLRYTTGSPPSLVAFTIIFNLVAIAAFWEMLFRRWQVGRSRVPQGFNTVQSDF